MFANFIHSKTSVDVRFGSSYCLIPNRVQVSDMYVCINLKKQLVQQQPRNHQVWNLAKKNTEQT